LDRIRALKGKVSEIILELFPGRLYFPANLVAKQTKSSSSVMNIENYEGQNTELQILMGIRSYLFYYAPMLIET